MFKRMFLFLSLLFMGSIIFSGAASAANSTNLTTGQSQYMGPITNTTNNVDSFSASNPPFSFQILKVNDNGTIYIGTYNDLYAMNQNFTLKWTFKPLGTVNKINGTDVELGPNSTIYYSSTDGNLYEVNSNGTMKKEYKFNLYSDAQF